MQLGELVGRPETRALKEISNPPILEFHLRHFRFLGTPEKSNQIARGVILFCFFFLRNIVCYFKNRTSLYCTFANRLWHRLTFLPPFSSEPTNSISTRFHLFIFFLLLKFLRVFFPGLQMLLAQLCVRSRSEWTSLVFFFPNRHLATCLDCSWLDIAQLATTNDGEHRRNSQIRN